MDSVSVFRAKKRWHLHHNQVVVFDGDKLKSLCEVLLLMNLCFIECIWRTWITSITAYNSKESESYFQQKYRGF